MRKKIFPVLVAIALIIVIGTGTLGSLFLKKYSPSKEKKDLEEYFQIMAPDEVAIVLNNDHIETKGKMYQGKVYLDFRSVQKLLNPRFFHDENEQLLIYTTPTEIIETKVGEQVYQINNVNGDSKIVEGDYPWSFYEEETLYISMDFVDDYTRFDYDVFSSPNRMQLTTTWEETNFATIKKDTAVRYRGGIKSDVLREINKGETVIVLEVMDKWSKVKTEDAFIGYVENKMLHEETTRIPDVASNYIEPEYTSLVRDYKINLGWHQVMSQAANDTLMDVVNRKSGLNVISPTWFSLKDNEGGIRSIATQGYVNQAHNMGMEVWALVDNFNKDVSTFTTLSHTTSRRRLISNLMSEVKKYGIDGINVDFENVSYDAGEPYVQFIRELSIFCRQEKIVLSIDNYVPRESTTHYNRKEQGIVADYVIIMGYDEHWGGGGVAGSVASIGFVEDGIRQTVEEVPSEKVINALPFYTRVWKTKKDQVTSEALDMETAKNFISNNHIDMKWDEATCQNYGEIQKGDTLYQIWMEDKESIEAKLNIMKKYELGGVAEWKLGFETPDIWDEIAKYMN